MYDPAPRPGRLGYDSRLTRNEKIDALIESGLVEDRSEAIVFLEAEGEI